MDYTTFIKKLGWKTNNLKEEFANALVAVERKEGRPVFFVEILYHLNQQAGSGKLSEDTVLKLRELQDSDYITEIDLKDLVNAFRNSLNRQTEDVFMRAAKQLLNDPVKFFHENLAGYKVLALEQWGVNVDKIFTESEPLLCNNYYKMDKNAILRLCAEQIHSVIWNRILHALSLRKGG